MSDYATTLRREDLDEDPLRQFRAWFEEAVKAGVRQPEAAALATASSDGAPSVRMVLVKAVDEQGFAFFTGYGSRKGAELTVNPRAALLFHWEKLGRQVRVEGAVARSSEAETAAYVRSRPYDSQISALASPQSEAIESRAALEARVADLEERYRDADLPLPSYWGGYRLAPESFEFWQHRDDRLHDRLRYRRGNEDGWLIERLAP